MRSKDNSFVCEPIDTEWNLPLDNFTVEFWFWMNGFDVNNQSVIDCDAFYIRLGNTQMITSAQKMCIRDRYVVVQRQYRYFHQ